MDNKAAIECVDVLLRHVMRNGVPFGGKTFLALGDFRQVAPVLRDVTAPASVFDSSIRSSPLWAHFEVLRLTQPIRNAGDPVYSTWVDCIGDGVPPYNKTISLQHLSRVFTIDEAAGFLFPANVLADPT